MVDWNTNGIAYKKLIAHVARTSKPNLKEVAAAIGEDCTEKAVTHRMAALKKLDENLGGSSTNSADTTATKAGAKAKPTPKGKAPDKASSKTNGKGETSSSNGKANGKGKRAAAKDGDHEGDDGEQSRGKKLKTEQIEP